DLALGLVGVVALVRTGELLVIAPGNSRVVVALREVAEFVGLLITGEPEDLGHHAREDVAGFEWATERTEGVPLWQHEAALAGEEVVGLSLLNIGGDVEVGDVLDRAVGELDLQQAAERRVDRVEHRVALATRVLDLAYGAAAQHCDV